MIQIPQSMGLSLSLSKNTTHEPKRKDAKGFFSARSSGKFNQLLVSAVSAPVLKQPSFNSFKELWDVNAISSTVSSTAPHPNMLLSSVAHWR